MHVVNFIVFAVCVAAEFTLLSQQTALKGAMSFNCLRDSMGNFIYDLFWRFTFLIFGEVHVFLALSAFIRYAPATFTVFELFSYFSY